MSADSSEADGETPAILQSRKWRMGIIFPLFWERCFCGVVGFFCGSQFVISVGWFCKLPFSILSLGQPP